MWTVKDTPMSPRRWKVYNNSRCYESNRFEFFFKDKVKAQQNTDRRNRFEAVSNSQVG